MEKYILEITKIMFKKDMEFIYGLQDKNITDKLIEIKEMEQDFCKRLKDKKYMDILLMES